MKKIKKQVEIIEALPNVSLTGKKTDFIKRVAAYCRVSSDHVEQKTSYLAQIDEYTKRINQNSSWEFVGIYADEGKSGTNTIKRTEFNRLISDCKNGKIDLIITKSISRFARNVEDCISVVRQLKDLEVEVFFEKDNISSFDSKSEMVFTILASVAQDESRNISENSTWGIRKRMRDGVPIVNHNRFLGYTKDENGELIIDEEEAKTIRYIFNRYMEGVGYTTIARELQGMGALTGAKNTKWHGSTVSGILQNEKYCGDLLLQKTITVDYLSHRRINNNKRQATQYKFSENHEPIISKELWLSVQNKREEKFSTTSGNNKNKERYASKYAFSGKLVCQKCGSTLKRRTWNAKSASERIVWQCNDYINRGKRCCDSKAVGDLTIKRAFVKLYNSIVKDKSAFFDTLIRVSEKVISKEQDKNQYNKLLKDISNVENKISGLVEMKMDGELSLEDFKREYEKLNLFRDKLVSQKECLINSENTDNEKLRKLSIIRETIKCNSNPLTEFDDKLFKTLVEKVIITSPVNFTFHLINGVKIPVEATKCNDGRKYKEREY